MEAETSSSPWPYLVPVLAEQGYNIKIDASSYFPNDNLPLPCKL